MSGSYVFQGLLERIAAGADIQSPRALPDVIAERLLADMNQKYKAPLQSLLHTLQAVESRADQNAPQMVRDAFLRLESVDDQVANAIESAYLLGMLAFANKFLAIAADSRSDDAVYEVIQDDTYRRLLDRIHFEGRSTVEALASFASREAEVVRTQLRHLNDLGIIGWQLIDAQGHQYFFREPGPAGWKIKECDRYYYLTESGKSLLGFQD